MPVIINGSTGISGTDGSASTPALQGTDGNTGVFFPAADQIAFSEGGVEVMRLDANGNVGIGTAVPGAKFQVIGGTTVAGYTNVAAVFGSGVTSELYVGSLNGNAPFVASGGANPLLFQTNGTERARITAAGEFQFNNGYGSVATAFGCRVWVNFNGTGTIAVRGSGGLSSVTDVGVGDYRLNFSFTMPDVNYCVLSVKQNMTTNVDTASTDDFGSRTTTSVRVVSVEGNTVADTFNFNAAIFR